MFGIASVVAYFTLHQGTTEIVPVDNGTGRVMSYSSIIYYILAYYLFTLMAGALLVYKLIKPQFPAYVPLFGASLAIIMAYILERKVAAMPMVDFSQYGMTSTMQMIVPPFSIFFLVIILEAAKLPIVWRKRSILIAVGLILSYVGIIIWTQSGKPQGLKGSAVALQVCPESNNCVCSMNPASDEKHHIAAIAYINGREETDKLLRDALLFFNHRFENEQQDYWHLRFTVSLFKFQDDVEFLFDDEQQVIQVRSASRLGRYDFGVSRKRIEDIRKLMQNPPQRQEPPGG